MMLNKWSMRSLVQHHGRDAMAYCSRHHSCNYFVWFLVRTGCSHVCTFTFVFVRLHYTMLKSLGTFARVWGRSLDKLGQSFQGSAVYVETLMPQTTYVSHNDKSPSVSSICFVAPSARLVGDVSVADRASVWYSASAKAEGAQISIGEKSNIQDGAMLHAADKAISIGNSVTVGPCAAITNGSKLEDGCMVGTNSIVDGSVVGKGSVLSANSRLEPGTNVPAGQLWGGSPAKFVRDVTQEEMNILRGNADELSQLASMHAEESSKSFSQIMAERAKYKELKEKLGRDSIQNPTINYFDDRPGKYTHVPKYFHQHGIFPAPSADMN